MKKGEPVNVSKDERIEFLRRVREARSLILRDSESFHLAVCTIEHIGQSLARKIGNGFNDYKNPILNFITTNTEENWGKVEPLFNLVRNARNDAVHGGAYIRHHTEKLNQLLIVLTEALMTELNQARDLMVDSPVVAHPWNQVAELRRQMLSNSFSYIPIVDLPGHPNSVVSEVGLAKLLSVNKANRNKLLALTIDDAVHQGMLDLESAPTCTPDTTKSEFWETASHLPTLVKDKDQLVGIITAFDLL